MPAHARPTSGGGTLCSRKPGEPNVMIYPFNAHRMTAAIGFCLSICCGMFMVTTNGTTTHGHLHACCRFALPPIAAFWGSLVVGLLPMWGNYHPAESTTNTVGNSYKSVRTKKRVFPEKPPCCLWQQPSPEKPAINTVGKLYKPVLT